MIEEENNEEMIRVGQESAYIQPEKFSVELTTDQGNINRCESPPRKDDIVSAIVSKEEDAVFECEKQEHEEEYSPLHKHFEVNHLGRPKINRMNTEKSSNRRSETGRIMPNIDSHQPPHQPQNPQSFDERTRLLNGTETGIYDTLQSGDKHRISEKKTTLALRSLFQPPTLPTKNIEIPNGDAPDPSNDPNKLPQTEKSTPNDSFSSSECSFRTTAETTLTAFFGGSLFVLFHIVFCLAQASAIPRPYSSRPILGTMVRIAALGPILGGPAYILLMGNDLPSLYPMIDSFPVPFLAQQSILVDEMLHEVGLENDDEIFFTTTCVLSGISLILSGLMILLATRIKLANLGAFLPFPVMCGFFTSVGLLSWTFAFSVDTGGNTVGDLIHGSGHMIGGEEKMSGWEFRKSCLIHHLPTAILGTFMCVVAKKNRILVPLLCAGTTGVAYVLMYVTNTTMKEARDQGWFWMDEDFRSDSINFLQGDERWVKMDWMPPLPFGVLIGVLRGKVYYPAVIKGIPIAFGYAAIYLIRCSLHAPALKKNTVIIGRIIEEQEAQKEEKMNLKTPVLTRPRCSSDDMEESIVGTMGSSATAAINVSDILNLYGKVLCILGFAGGSACLPSIGTAATLSKLGATGKAPQYASIILLFGFYLTKFEIVSYIPKITFSSLLIVASVDLMKNWFLMSYNRHANKKEWVVVPLLVVFAFTVGILQAVAVGIAISTFIFVGTFYSSGIVKFIANGLTVHSTIERSVRHGEWLDQNGDLIQILVLQNYLFFGNANSLCNYVATMFEEIPADQMNLDFPLPPIPKYVVIDMTLVTGMDTSAVDILGEIITMCKNNNCQVYISGLNTTIKTVLSCGGVKPSSNSGVRFMPDLEAALGKAEDGLLKFVYKVQEKEQARIKMRRMSIYDDGFVYALEQIDAQHGTDCVDGLEELGLHTQVVELRGGESLYHDNNGNLTNQIERGLFFIEAGIMKVERDPTLTLSRGNTASLKRKGMGAIYATPRITQTSSFSELHVRTPTIGREAAMLKNASKRIAETKNVRLAKFGPGWVVGAMEGCSQLLIPGLYSAVTACRLHHLPYRCIEDLEETNPALVLRLFKMLSRISVRRQESTIQQLTTFHSIMTSLAPTKPVSRVTLAAIKHALGSEV